VKKTSSADAQGTKWVETWLDRVDWGDLGIPIMKGLKNEGRTSRVNVNILARLGEMAEQLIYCSNGRFKTKTQVYRAAVYIGLSILYRMYNDGGGGNTYGNFFYESVKRSEKRLLQAEIIETLLEEMDALHKKERMGLISDDDLQDAVKDMKMSLPEDMRVGIEKQIMNAFVLKNMKGSKAVEFFEKGTKYQGLIEE